MNSKPTFEDKCRADAEKMIDLQNIAIKLNAWQTCLTCEFWQGNMGQPPRCEKFKAMPPPHIIVTGCPDYIHDIPF